MNPLHQTIQHLRQQEALLLHGHLTTIAPDDEAATLRFLQSEYENEQLDYPHEPPTFHPETALWAAKYLFIAAQLLLHRQHETKKLPTLLPVFEGYLSAQAILSADLCLRFVPALLDQLKAIDPEDELIQLLQAQLQRWHYSGVPKIKNTEDIDLTAITTNPCLHQLYIDRVVRHKNKVLSEHPALQPGINASLGLYSELLMP